MSNNQPSVARENTPLESFTQRIETLSDRIGEQRRCLTDVIDRIVGCEAEKGISGSDRPEASPSEYNSMNYAIDTLCNNVDTLATEIARMQDTL